MTWEGKLWTAGCSCLINQYRDFFFPPLSIFLRRSGRQSWPQAAGWLWYKQDREGRIKRACVCVCEWGRLNIECILLSLSHALTSVIEDVWGKRLGSCIFFIWLLLQLTTNITFAHSFYLYGSWMHRCKQMQVPVDFKDFFPSFFPALSCNLI